MRLPEIAWARDLLSVGCHPWYPKLRTDIADIGQTMFGDESLGDSSYVSEIYEKPIWCQCDDPSVPHMEKPFSRCPDPRLPSLL